MRLLLTIFIFLAGINAQAALYKYTNEKGEVIYSDKPPYEGAEELNPPKLQITPAIKIKPGPIEKPKEKEQEKVTKYTAFQITSPKNGETLQNNAGNVNIALAIKPGLNTIAGDYINILMDGSAITKKSTNLSTTFNHIDRGTHSIQAELRDQSGKLIMFSNIVIIHVHRFSILHKKPTP